VSITNFDIDCPANEMDVYCAEDNLPDSNMQRGSMGAYVKEGRPAATNAEGSTMLVG
jgi:hypothetical protein